MMAERSARVKQGTHDRNGDILPAATIEKYDLIVGWFRTRRPAGCNSAAENLRQAGGTRRKAGSHRRTAINTGTFPQDHPKRSWHLSGKVPISKHYGVNYRVKETITMADLPSAL